MDLCNSLCINRGTGMKVKKSLAYPGQVSDVLNAHASTPFMTFQQQW